jgi:hypothetical protein
MKLEIINPVNSPQWDDLLVTMNDYSFFHSSAWAKVLFASYQYSPVYFTLTDGGKLLAMLPVMEVNSFLTGRRGVSLAFADYCEPIAEGQDEFRALLDCVIDYGKKAGWKYLELRGGERFLADMPASDSYLVHTLDLCPDEQQQLAQFRDSTRRNIRNATMDGVQAEVSTTLESVGKYYELHCITRKRHGLPPQPFYFFRNIHDYIISRNNGVVVLASYDNRIIAGAVYFRLGSKALYKFGASDKKYQHLRANNLVMWEALKWHALAGCTTFCFGRTDQENEGLSRFKNGWGTVQKTFNYYRYDLKREAFLNNTGQGQSICKKIVSKMPDTVVKSAGRLLYRHMG